MPSMTAVAKPSDAPYTEAAKPAGHRPRFPDHRSREHPLSGQDVQLVHEPARANGGQLPHHTGLVVDHGDGPGQDHHEVVTPISLTRQHLAAPGPERLAYPAHDPPRLPIQPPLRTNIPP